MFEELKEHLETMLLVKVLKLEVEELMDSIVNSAHSMKLLQRRLEREMEFGIV